jgi:hypothetical protein
VKLWVASGAMPLLALIEIVYVPPVPALGVPASVAVPLLLLVKVTLPGNPPVSVITMLAFVGKPVVVTVKVPAVPTLKVVLFALVIAGAWPPWMFAVPVIVAVTVSVAVMLWLPGLFNVALKMCEPLSPATKV